MDGLISFCPLADYVAQITDTATFVLVDVGVAGGIDRQWRRLGRRLKAIGIDPSVHEVARLTAGEKNPNVKYVNAFATLAADHLFAQKLRAAKSEGCDPWLRLSASQYLEIVYPPAEKLGDRERLAANQWQSVQLASPESAIVVPEYLVKNGIHSVDFLKIDVDGKDFEILNSFDQAFAAQEIIGVGIEVNYFGSGDETENSFHNVDRFLKSNGFELFHLTTRRYSTRAMPGNFVGQPAGPTEFGRALQGDALYVRDLAGGRCPDFAARLSADKILNLILIYAMFNLPDCAAETAQAFAAKLSTVCDVDKILDLLAEQADRSVLGPTAYRARLDRFVRNPRSFLPTRNPLVQAARALRTGFLKWRGKAQLRRVERNGM